MTADFFTSHKIWASLSVAVPAYSRPSELRELCASVAQLEFLPGELLICEDRSPDRLVLREIAAEWAARFAVLGCHLRYIENKENLGYDANVRNLLEQAAGTWVLLLGNDDVVLPGAVAELKHFVELNPNVMMSSRTFVRFAGNPGNILGVTSLAPLNRVFTRSNSSPGMIMRLCGFVGGLLINLQWARSLATDRYDGTLYYQIYLAIEAFAGNGIGYIAAPLVGSRAGNPPLFGSAAKERGIHAPGAYSAQSRAAMWSGVLRMSEDAEVRLSMPIVNSMRRELSGRQSFHVFELVTTQGRVATWHLIKEFVGLGLMGHPMPWCIGVVALILGRQIRIPFALFRGLQKWRTGPATSAVPRGRASH